MKSKEIKYIKSDIIEGVILSDIKEGIMKIKGILILILSLISVFIITSCDSPNTDVSQLYDDIYTENTEYSLDGKQQIINRFDEAGLSAVDIGNQINMTNWEVIDEFCSHDEDGEAVVYVINDDGSCTEYDLSITDDKLHVKMQVSSGGNESVVTYEQEYDAVYWDYTDKGYLFFGAEHPAGDFGPWLETTIRVKPMDADLRGMTQKYLNVIGYEDNNLFIENWNENDFTVLNLYDIYEVITGNIDAENEIIPASDFESVISKYLDISVSEIHENADYDPGADAYHFSSRTAEAKGSTPDMPYPEVVSVTDNDDGTITLLVEAVWPKYWDDKAYVHEVTVRPEGDNFKYVSNRIVEKKMDTKWYVGR